MVSGGIYVGFFITYFGFLLDAFMFTPDDGSFLMFLCFGESYE